MSKFGETVKPICDFLAARLDLYYYNLFRLFTVCWYFADLSFALYISRFDPNLLKFGYFKKF